MVKSAVQCQKRFVSKVCNGPKSTTKKHFHIFMCELLNTKVGHAQVFREDKTCAFLGSLFLKQDVGGGV